MIELNNDYTEYFIEYDPEHLVVYINGLDQDGFWNEIKIVDEVNDPESYAEGFVEAATGAGIFASMGMVVYEKD